MGDPAALLPLMPRLEPLVKGAVEKIADPEARAVAERAYKTLTKASAGAENKNVTKEGAMELIKGLVGGKASDEVALNHVAGLAMSATNLRNFDADAWKNNVGIV